jgi:hypothetical protein
VSVPVAATPRIRASGCAARGCATSPSSGPSPHGNQEETLWRCDMGIIVTILAIIGLIVVLSMIF